MLTRDNPFRIESQSLGLTFHAQLRANARRLGVAAIEAALRYGRVLHVRGAAIHVIGRREVETYKRHNIDLIPFEGVQVVCSRDDRMILTAYRNRDFRGLHPTRRRRYAHSWAAGHSLDCLIQGTVRQLAFS